MESVSYMQYVLSKIYPEDHFVFDCPFEKTDVPKGIKYRTYSFDAICKEKKLIVNFDGPRHYNSTSDVLEDIEEDKWVMSFGYTVIRVPFWVPLSAEAIKDLFDVGFDEDPINDICSFLHPDAELPNLNSLPGNMCELGRQRFVREFNRLNQSTRSWIIDDLFKCVMRTENEPGDFAIDSVVPTSVATHMNLYDLLVEPDERAQKVEHIIFEEDYNTFKYPYGFRCFFDLDADRLESLVDLAPMKGDNQDFSYDATMRFLRNVKDSVAVGCNFACFRDDYDIKLNGFYVQHELTESDMKEVEKIQKQITTKLNVEYYEGNTFICVP